MLAGDSLHAVYSGNMVCQFALEACDITPFAKVSSTSTSCCCCCGSSNHIVVVVVVTSMINVIVIIVGYFFPKIGGFSRSSSRNHMGSHLCQV